MKKIIFPTILVVITGIAYLFLTAEKTAEYPPEFTLEQDFQSGLSSTKIFTNDTDRVKIVRTQRLQPESLERWSEQDRQRFLGNFSPSISPYPGAISDSLVCDSEFIPSIIEEGSYFYTQTHASARYTYGVCDESTIRHQSLILWETCSDNTVNRIEYIYPLEQKSPIIEHVARWSCL